MSDEGEFARAVGLHASGRTADAEAACRGIVGRDPGEARALHLLGVIRWSAGAQAEAVALLRKAVAAKPDYPEASFNLGVMLMTLGELDAAAVALAKAAAAWPDHFDAHGRLAAVLLQLGRRAEAEAPLARALALRPDDALILADLALVARDQGKTDDAIAYGRRAVALAPELASARLELGRALNQKGDFAAAIDELRRARDLAPASADAANALTATLLDARDFDGAAASARDAVARHPGSAAAVSNVAAVALARGETAMAVEHYRRAIAMAPGRPDYHRGLMAAVLYDPDIAAESRFEVHGEFGRAMAAQAKDRLPPCDNVRDPGRRLRVGWVSSDFRDHPVARNLDLLFAHYDRAQLAMYAYAEVPSPDTFSARFRERMAAWRSTVGLSDEAVARQMRADEIDIAIHLAGRFDRNRPQIAVWRPAPLQITMHDPATSGLAEIDYLIADPVLAPRRAGEKFVERVVRIPSFFLHPPIGWASPAGPPPARANGFVTFGSFNNPAKLNDRVLSLWAEILRRVPEARLQIKFRNAFASRELRERVRNAFPNLGERIAFLDGDQPAGEHLALYQAIDIALDPFPFTGSTTTFEALWMGVPVVTLAGDTMAGRWTAAMLHALRLDDLIAAGADDYVGIAVRLADDGDRLAALRAGLRNRVAQSPLCDGRTYARHFERLLRAMWRRWCAAGVS